MGRSNRFVDMNKVYVHVETTRKEQPIIHLWHMGGGPNGCHRQPILRFVEAEGKFISETQQHMDDQFVRINLKPRLPKYPTCVVTMGMDRETLL